MKPKTVNGQKLNGELFISMLQSYLNDINAKTPLNI